MDSVKAYLFTIARNLFLQQKRRKKKFSPIAEEMHDATIQTEQLVENRSELEQTLSALQTLPEIDRTLLIMRTYNEISYENIAKATGLTISTVKVKIFRARIKLSSLTSHE